MTSILEQLSGEQKRDINNQVRNVDGANIPVAEKDKRSFEAMTPTIFRPEDVKG